MSSIIIYIGGIERQHLAGKDGNGLAIMSGFGFRVRINNFTTRKHARKKRFSASITPPHPTMGGTDRLFEIVHPAR